jgi:hypothetical protein
MPWHVESKLSPSSSPSPIKGEGIIVIRHPEPSLCEGARISSNTADVILSGVFPREDLIFYISLFFKNTLKDEILTSHNTLLRK